MLFPLRDSVAYGTLHALEEERCEMIEDGRAHGGLIATKHLLKLLASKGLITKSDIVGLHDDAQAELRDLIDRNVLSADEGGKGARGIGSLLIP